MDQRVVYVCACGCRNDENGLIKKYECRWCRQHQNQKLLYRETVCLVEGCGEIVQSKPGGPLKRRCVDHQYRYKLAMNRIAQAKRKGRILGAGHLPPPTVAPWVQEQQARLQAALSRSGGCVHIGGRESLCGYVCIKPEFRCSRYQLAQSQFVWRKPQHWHAGRPEISGGEHTAERVPGVKRAKKRMEKAQEEAAK